MDYKSYRTKPLTGLKAAVQKMFFIGNLEATETSNISLNMQGCDMAGAFFSLSCLLCVEKKPSLEVFRRF